MEWKEFKGIDRLYIGMEKYSKTDIKCPECGEDIYIDNTIVLTSNPPKHRYICRNCKWEGTA